MDAHVLVTNDMSLVSDPRLTLKGFYLFYTEVDFVLYLNTKNGDFRNFLDNLIFVAVDIVVI